jgi:hypothetical protein
MQHLQRISWILTLLGLVVTLVSWLASPDQVWLLAGILLTMAGIVKVIMVTIWLRVAGLGDDTRQPTRSV